MVEITYHKEGNFFVPNLYLEKEDYENNYIIGKYGHLRLEYLKNHKKAEYIIMFMNKTLRNLKNTNPLKWTGLMNNYKNSVEEIIFKELIYC